MLTPAAAAIRDLGLEYVTLAEEHLQAGWIYTNHLPFRSARVRLACAWPILIGAQTVRLLRRDEFLRRGPALTAHPAFPAGVNVQFARQLGEQMLEAWIWERGAGETLASGSSACAVAAAAVRLGLARPGALAIRMPGGTAQVEVSPDYQLRLRAPAVIVFECEVREQIADAWGKL